MRQAVAFGEIAVPKVFHVSVGLRLCALEYSAKQLNILSYLTMSGPLPETFPHEKWVLAVQRSNYPGSCCLYISESVGGGSANSRVSQFWDSLSTKKIYIYISQFLCYKKCGIYRTVGKV